MNPYQNLINIRIIQIQKNPRSHFMFFEPRPEPEKPDMWMAIFHNIYRKWIVINDIEKTGLNDRSDVTEVIGFAESLEGILFVIWEHQKELGMKETILDEIRRNKKQIAKDDEWTGWEKDTRTMGISPFQSLLAKQQDKFRGYGF